MNDGAVSTPRAPLAADESYRVEAQIGFLLRKAHQRASEIFHQVMARHDVTPTQFTTLVKLADVGETSQNHLGRLVATDPATTLGVVGRLGQRGLIELRSDPADRRRRLLRLSKTGARLVGEMTAHAAEVSSRTLAPLSEDERRCLLRLLRAIG